MTWQRLAGLGLALFFHLAAVYLLLPEHIAGAMMEGHGRDDLSVMATVSLENGDLFTHEAQVAAAEVAVLKPQESKPQKEAEPEKPQAESPSPTPLPPEKESAPDERVASAASQAEDAQTASAAKAAKRNASLSAYQTALYSALERHKVHVAKSGDVLLQVVLAPAGEIIARQVIKSSGIPELDRAAIAAFDRSAPFPPVPPEISTGPITLAVPFRFRVQ